MTTAKDFVKYAPKPQRWKIPKLPFQYTPEGRAQLAARRSMLLKPPSLVMPELLTMFPKPLTAEEFSKLDTPFYEPAPATDPNIKPVEDTRAMVRSHASYLTQLFEDTDVSVNKFRAKMRSVDFDTLVGSGISGTLAAQLFARALAVNFAIVRKGNDGTHSNNAVEGNVGKRWVFVDDLICSGETRSRVRNAMKLFCEQNNWASTYVGDYLYYGNKFRDRENGNSEEG